MPNIDATLAALRLRLAVIDGEAIFDVMHLDGRRFVRPGALEDRRAILADLLRKPGPLSRDILA
jgi:hypothetical protein